MGDGISVCFLACKFDYPQLFEYHKFICSHSVKCLWLDFLVRSGNNVVG